MGQNNHQTVASVGREQTRKLEEWREANKEDIERRVAKFRLAYDKIVEECRLFIAGDYCELYLLDIDYGSEGVWVADLEP